MAEGKKTFIFYSDWINMVREMPNEDAGLLLKHILSYVNDENPTTDNPLIKMAFGHMKPMLKADLDKWDKQLKKYSAMGKASAEKRKKQHKATQVEPTLTQVEPMNTVNDNVNVNVNDNVNALNKRKADFRKSCITFYGEKYGIGLVNDFFDYWSEHNEKGKKMRFEYAKNQPFNISRRLSTWFKNQKRFEKEKTSGKKEKVSASDIILQRHGLSKTQ